MAILFALIKTVRPRQWLKNLALFAALVFSGQLFIPESFGLALRSAIVFTILSSTTYIFNDLLDMEADKQHPLKKSRPIASQQLPVEVAVVTLIIGILFGLIFAYQINYYLFLSSLIYMIVQVAYTTYLKKIPIMDVITVAFGYLIRVYAGAFVISAHMDVWFLLTVISVSLFLAVGKRRSEMTLMLAQANGMKSRVTLKRYTESLLDIYTSMFATAAWITYSMFTFNHPRIIPDGRALMLISFLPRTLLSEKWLMITIPFVVYGIMRYLQLIYEKGEGESPEKILLQDKPLMFTVLTWITFVVGVLYYVG